MIWKSISKHLKILYESIFLPEDIIWEHYYYQSKRYWVTAPSWLQWHTIKDHLSGKCFRISFLCNFLHVPATPCNLIISVTNRPELSLCTLAWLPSVMETPGCIPIMYFLATLDWLYAAMWRHSLFHFISSYFQLKNSNDFDQVGMKWTANTENEKYQVMPLY